MCHSKLPATVQWRAADAMHLACASENIKVLFMDERREDIDSGVAHQKFSERFWRSPDHWRLFLCPD
jgi:hypothetical protein